MPAQKYVRPGRYQAMGVRRRCRTPTVLTRHVVVAALPYVVLTSHRRTGYGLRALQFALTRTFDVHTRDGFSRAKNAGKALARLSRPEPDGIRYAPFFG